jgi:cbb3-type cytochrome oxidase subunit 3
MELMYNLLVNFLFAFMTVGFVVLTAGLMFWLLLLGPKKKTRTYGFSRGGALIAI